MIRKYSLTLLAAAAIGLTASIASAADLPRKAPVYAPPPPPPFSWTGFYVGLHAGWGWNSGDAAVNDGLFTNGLFDPVSLAQKGDGVVGGLQVGYNWQISNFVVGIEGDFSGSGIRATSTAPVTIGGVPFGAGFQHTAERDINWLASVRGRIGYAADRWLVYFTGGGAWAHIDYTAGPVFAGLYNSAQFSHTSSGWVVGGGVEYAFTNNWTARVEYLHYDLDDVSFANTFVPAPGTGFEANTNWDNGNINVVRAGINYKF